MAIQNTPPGQDVSLPEPDRIQQRRDQQEQQQGKEQGKERADWERMGKDPEYRKEMEERARQQREAQQQERGGPQRPTGRER